MYWCTPSDPKEIISPDSTIPCGSTALDHHMRRIDSRSDSVFTQTDTDPPWRSLESTVRIQGVCMW
eukprot:1883670-Rhodomonas_salina.1